MQSRWRLIQQKITQHPELRTIVPIFSETLKTSDTFALPAEDVVPEEASMVESPLGGGDIVSDADSENADEDPLPRAQRLQAEARSVRHQIVTYPKNPYCDTCRRSRMYRRKVTQKRHDPLADRGDLEPVAEFGQRL